MSARQDLAPCEEGPGGASWAVTSTSVDTTYNENGDVQQASGSVVTVAVCAGGSRPRVAAHQRSSKREQCPRRPLGASLQAHLDQLGAQGRLRRAEALLAMWVVVRDQEQSLLPELLARARPRPS